MTVPIERRAIPHCAHQLAEAGVLPVLARIYAARGIASTAELEEGLARLPTFASLMNIDAAAQRLAAAIAARERIVIVADYDADGATACAVGVRGLRAMGAEVDFVVGNRFEYGYGLTPEVVALAAERAPRLIVTVDNGIGSIEGVAAARARGIDVLITDHHLPGATLPEGAIVVDPNQRGCAFPSKHVAGVGVMFYVLLALRARLRAQGAFDGAGGPNLATLLDLVALGTVADVVRLDHTNRILVLHGLGRIAGGRAHAGVAALFEVAGRDPRRATAFDLGYVAGPRLNAAGRLADMSIGIRCLLAESREEALPLAAALDRLNRERREVEATMQDQALEDLERVAGSPDDAAFTLCLYRSDWHQGVVGIVASRLKDRFHRPAIVFARAADGELRGSGRSIAGFHLRDALDLVAKRDPTTVRRFGGHAFAAGLSIDEAALPRFASAFEDVARAQLTPTQLRRVCETDGTLGRGELTFELAELLRNGVWGQGFPAPSFDGVFAVTDQRLVGDKHMRLTLERDGERFEGIAFGRTDPVDARIHAAYRPDVHEWNGQRSLQLVVEHWLPDAPP